MAIPSASAAILRLLALLSNHVFDFQVKKMQKDFIHSVILKYAANLNMIFGQFHHLRRVDNSLKTRGS